MKAWTVIILCSVIGTVFIVVLVNFLVIRFNGKSVPVPTISREPEFIGSGKDLTYVVMGDSTSIGQGALYNESFSRLSAEHLSKKYKVRFVNVGVSGARSKDLIDDQLPKAIQYNPDVVLISIGANDVTHFTSIESVRNSLNELFSRLKEHNPKIQIIVTGSPDVGTVDRFVWPVKQILGMRTKTVNTVFDELIPKYALIHAPIYDKVGPAFANNPGLYAVDKFHPNSQGYALWVPVINEALDKIKLDN